MSIQRIIIVGLGNIGKRHLSLARKLIPEADIRVLRHQECITIPKGANGCFSNIDEAISFAPNLAVIANPASHHIGVALPLARAGVHLLIEKPLSNSLRQVKELIEISNKKGIVLTTGYNLRFLPSLNQFRKILKNGFIGKVFSVRCEVGKYLPLWRSDIDYRKTVSAQHEFGGGALLELSHEIDYLRWIFGEIEWVKASLSKQSNLEIKVEDTAHLIFGFGQTSDYPKLIANLNLDFIRHDSMRLCTAIGEKGSLRWNGLTGVVEHFQIDAKKWEILYKKSYNLDDSYEKEWQHFISCIKEETNSIITGEDGMKVLQIIQAVRLSEETGQKENVS